MEFNYFLRPSPKIQGLFKTVETLDQEFGGEELSLFVCPGVGNRPPRKKKFANPQECAWGGGGAWQEDKLNYALTEREEKVLLSSKSHS